jgi:hypothetical protein
VNVPGTDVALRETRQGWALTFPVATHRERRQLHALATGSTLLGVGVLGATGSWELSGLLAMVAFLLVLVSASLRVARDQGVTLLVTATHLEVHGLRVALRDVLRLEARRGAHHGTLLVHTVHGVFPLMRYPDHRDDPEGIDGDAVLAWMQPLLDPVLRDGARRRGNRALVPDQLDQLR